MTNSTKSAIVPGLFLTVTCIISEFFGAPLELIVVLVMSFLCGLFAIYLYSKTFRSRLRLTDGVTMGLNTVGISWIPLLIILAVMYFIFPTKFAEELSSSGTHIPSRAFILCAVIGALVAVPILEDAK